jgi:pyruvate dehydrogenase E2 component (dihydrolipoamide acetyltransferase)
MSIDVIMPQMGESIFEGTITKWLKKAGDAVEKDEPLFEISTDKVDAEIPSPVAGVLTEIKIDEGATVQVNTVVAVISDSASAVQRSAATQLPAPQVVQESRPADALLQRSAPLQVAQVLVMPQMGESIVEGTITKWLKKVGDAFEKDEPLFEISTDKVDAEIPAPLSGVLTEIRVQEGETVPVNSVVAIIATSGQATTPVQKAAPPQLAPKKAAQVAPAAKTVHGSPIEPGIPIQKAAPPQVAATQVPGRRIRSSPLARRIAKEHGIDLAPIAGTGHAGRVTKDDVLRASAQSPVQRSAPLQVAPQVVQVPGELVPLTRMRAIIAERMLQSKHISPHVHTVYKIDMTRVVQHRQRNMAAFEQRHGIKLTFMPYIATAAVTALQRYSVVNASLESSSNGLGIRYHQNVNLGIAVALDWGLIVPTVRQAEQQNFASLARIIADLALRARTKKLSPDEVGGSTFTLTNSGIFGDEFSTPIINQPESAILCISALKKEPGVLTDAEGNDTIAIRSMQHFTLGFDHRLIDGADACKFMLELKRVLESWSQGIA